MYACRDNILLSRQAYIVSVVICIAIYIIYVLASQCCMHIYVSRQYFVVVTSIYSKCCNAYYIYNYICINKSMLRAYIRVATICILLSRHAYLVSVVYYIGVNSRNSIELLGHIYIKYIYMHMFCLLVRKKASRLYNVVRRFY